MGGTKSILQSKNLISFIVAILCGILIFLLPLQSVDEKEVLAVVIFMLVLFITEAVPLAIAGLLGCMGFWIVCDLPFQSAFGGFVDNTPWFILGALMIGAAAVKSRIPERAAYLILKKGKLTYPAILASLIVLDFFMTIIIPSGSARVVVLCTVAMGLINSFGVDKHSNLAKGMILVLTYAATIFDKTIVAGAASILARGSIESISGISISWGKWFVAYAPVDILTMIALWFIVIKMFPPEGYQLSTNNNNENGAFAVDKLKEMGPMTPENYRVLIILLTATLLWATDFLHGISAAQIGIIAGLIAFIPGFGVLKREDFTKLNFSIFVFVGAALSMGLVLTETPILNEASKMIFSWLTPAVGHPHILSALLYIFANIFHLFLGSEIALIGTTLPFVLDFAQTNGLNPETIGMLWTFAAGGKLFIYQSAVLALGYSFGTFTTKDLFRLGLASIIIQLLLVSIVVPVYWNMIGLTIVL